MNSLLLIGPFHDRAFFRKVWSFLKWLKKNYEATVLHSVVVGFKNYTNILHAAFMHVGPNGIKRHWWPGWLFAQLVSVGVKAVHKLLMKSTPCCFLGNVESFRINIGCNINLTSLAIIMLVKSFFFLVQGLTPKFLLNYYRSFHRFGQAKFAYGCSISGSSQFTLLPQLPLKTILDLKVVKIDSKIIISLY